MTEAGSQGHDADRGSQRRFAEALLGSIADPAYVFDRDHRLVYANRAAFSSWNVDAADALGKRLGELGTAPEPAARMDALMDQLFRTGEPIREQLAAIDDSKDECIELVWSLLPGGDGTPEYLAGTSRDITEQHRLCVQVKEGEQRQRELLAELKNRVRNILATLRSVARRTSESSATVEDYAQHLEGRIGALGRTQAILTRHPGEGVRLTDIVDAELLSVAAQQQQYRCKGPDVVLEPRAAEVLTLALHELATNAVKYGAFSQPQARVGITWCVEERDDGRWLALEWREENVSGVDALNKPGFGTELITRRIPYELGGSGSLEPGEGGIRATVAFPLRPGDSIQELDTALTGDGGK